MKLIPVVMIAVGLVLLYCAITDRSPIEVVKAGVKGEDMPESGSLSEAVDEKPEVPITNTPEDGEWHGAPGDQPPDFDVPPGTTLTGNNPGGNGGSRYYTDDGRPIYNA